LAVVPITIPPLRERQGDLRLLARHFLNRFGREFKKENLMLSESAVKLMESYRWPGNVRELQNCMERAVIMCEGTEIFPEDLNLAFQQALPVTEAPEGFDLSGTLSEASLRAMMLVEKAKIFQALRQAKWNKTKASEALSVGYKTLLGKIKEYGLEESDESAR
jgi:DNA-binding NtrC family response regulator